MIDDLTVSQIPPGSNILVEFDPASQWYNASIAMTAGWIRTGGKVEYHVMAQAPERIRSVIQHLASDSEKMEQEASLQIIDYYTATLGRKSGEKFSVNSLKVAELSIEFAKEYAPGKLRPDTLAIADNVSTMGRFNDEKSWMEFALTRVLPGVRTTKSRGIDGLLTDLHSPWVYRQSEAAYDGIIDFKVEEEGKTARDVVRVRSMRDVGFDRGRHEVRLGKNFEITLVKQ